jgi:hypothetical protein
LGVRATAAEFRAAREAAVLRPAHPARISSVAILVSLLVAGIVGLVYTSGSRPEGDFRTPSACCVRRAEPGRPGELQDLHTGEQRGVQPGFRKPRGGGRA